MVAHPFFRRDTLANQAAVARCQYFDEQTEQAAIACAKHPARMLLQDHLKIPEFALVDRNATRVMRLTQPNACAAARSRCLRPVQSDAK